MPIFIDMKPLVRTAWRTAWWAARYRARHGHVPPWPPPWTPAAGIPWRALRLLLPRAVDLLGIREQHRACRRCGCTWARACAGGCGWMAFDLCSACAPWTKEEREALRAQVRQQLGLPAQATPPITEEDDRSGAGVRVFKINARGRCVDSILVDRFAAEDKAAGGPGPVVTVHDGPFSDVVNAYSAMIRDKQPVDVTLGHGSILLLHETLRLVLRHPQLPAQERNKGETLAGRFAEALGPLPDMGAGPDPSPAYAEAVRALCAREPTVLRFSKLEVFWLIGLVQMATRHPDLGTAGGT